MPANAKRVTSSEHDLIVAGYFEGDNFDADPGSAVLTLVATENDDGNNNDFTDLFIEKLGGSTLGLKWVQQLAGTGTEFADDMAVDSADNIIITNQAITTFNGKLGSL